MNVKAICRREATESEAAQIKRRQHAPGNVSLGERGLLTDPASNLPVPAQADGD